MRTIHRHAASAAAVAAVLLTTYLPYASAQDASGATGVTIPVKLTQRLSSDSVKEGDRFTFVTTQAARVGDVSVPAGTTGHGVVSQARKATLDRGGELSLQLQSIDLPGGTSIPVTAPRGPQAEKRNVVAEAAKAATSVATPSSALTTALVPLSVPVRGIIMLGSALHMLKGHNVIFDAGTTFSVVATPPNNQTAPTSSSSGEPVPQAT